MRTRLLHFLHNVGHFLGTSASTALIGQIRLRNNAFRDDNCFSDRSNKSTSRLTTCGSKVSANSNRTIQLSHNGTGGNSGCMKLESFEKTFKRALLLRNFMRGFGHFLDGLAKKIAALGLKSDG